MLIVLDNGRATPGMNVAAGPKLAAAVTNAGMVPVSALRTLSFTDAPAGGIGVIGGIHSSPKMLQGMIDELKSNLENKDAPFGVDLALPQVGGNARKTNVRAHHIQRTLSENYIDENIV